MSGIVAAAWAIIGWSGVLLIAIYRLARVTAEALDTDLAPAHVLAAALNVVFMAYAEGYRGFQRRFSPRAAARVLYLRRHASWALAPFAPLFCIGYFRATGAILRLTYIGTLLIVGAVLVVHQFPQPWRGIVDAGVVAGLIWGLLSFWILTSRALRTDAYPTSPLVGHGSVD
jgi:hypothetical protein